VVEAVDHPHLSAEEEVAAQQPKQTYRVVAAGAAVP